MNKLLFVCSRTTNDKHRGVIAVQDVFLLNNINPHINRTEATLLKDLYIASAIKGLNKKDSIIKEAECINHIGIIDINTYLDVIYKCRTELEQYYDSIVCFSNKLEVIDFNFHKDK